jgi:hypothetical protein
MPTNDLAAPNAVGIVQNDVKSLNIWMGGQKSFGFGKGGAGGADRVIHGKGFL